MDAISSMPRGRCQTAGGLPSREDRAPGSPGVQPLQGLGTSYKGMPVLILTHEPAQKSVPSGKGSIVILPARHRHAAVLQDAAGPPGIARRVIQSAQGTDYLLQALPGHIRVVQVAVNPDNLEFGMGSQDLSFSSIDTSSR